MELDTLRLACEEDHRAAIGGAGRLVAVCRTGSGAVCHSAPDNGTFDVEQLFAGTCGFCHSAGGRAAGKGPQLMNSPRDDDLSAQPHQERQVWCDAGIRRGLHRRADRPDRQIYPRPEAARGLNRRRPMSIRGRGMKTVLPLVVGAVIGLLKSCAGANPGRDPRVRCARIMRPSELASVRKQGRRSSRLSDRIGPGAGTRARGLAATRLDHHPVPDAERRLRHCSGRHRRPRSAG